MLLRRPSRVAFTPLNKGYLKSGTLSSCFCSLWHQCCALEISSKRESWACETIRKLGVGLQLPEKQERVLNHRLYCLLQEKSSLDFHHLIAHREFSTVNTLASAGGLGFGSISEQKSSDNPSEQAFKCTEIPCETPLISKCMCQTPSVQSKESSKAGAYMVESLAECGIDGKYGCVCAHQKVKGLNEDHAIEWNWEPSLDYPSALRSCGSNKALCLGKQLHHELCCNSMENDIYTGVVLVEMYFKCEAIEDAHSIFFSLHVHTTFSWNLMIRSYTSQGQDAESLQCLHRVLAEASIADKYTYVSLLSSCVNLADLGATQRIHTCIASGLHQSDIIVRNSLINAYGKCGGISEARVIFDVMSERDSFSWDTLIGAYVQHKLHDEALCLFYLQRHQGVLPTRITYVAILDSIASQGVTNKTTCILAQIFGSEFKTNVIVQTAVLNFFGKVGSVEDAWRMFCEMSQRSAYSWNAILAACPRLIHGEGTLDLYSRMLGEGILPEEETTICILSLCTDHKVLALGKWMHACSINSPNRFRLVVGNAFIGMYSRCAGLKDACRAFDWMLERNIITWTTMVSAFVEHGQAMLALELFHQMLGEGLLPDKIMLIGILDACASLHSPARLKQLHARIVSMGLDSDLEVASSLAGLYGKCGAIKAAQRMLDSISDRSTLLWTSMISAYLQHDHADTAIQFFHQMKEEGILPNEVTFFSVLDACAKLSALVQGRRFHAHLSSSGYGDVSVKTALIDMYGRCGSLEESQRIFNDVEEKDIVVLTAMMATYTQNGQVKQALLLFDKASQKGVKPDAVAYINVLSMCSHAGLVDEARRYFSSMSCDHGIKPTIHHYSCMIDLFGRVGCLSEAEDMIKNMPYTATALQWMTLLTACRRQLDIERGEHAARKVMLLEPKNPIPYVELANIYSAVHREAEAAALLSKVKELE